MRYRSGGYASGALVKTSPRLKNASETEKARSASRSTFRSDKGRRRSARPTKKTRHRPTHTYQVLSVRPPKAPSTASHLPGDLWAGPRLGHLAARVLDRGEDYLARSARPCLDDPGSRVGSELRRRGGVGGIAVEPTSDLRLGERGARRLGLGERRGVAGGRGSRRARHREGKSRGGESGDQPRGPNDQSLLPMKLTGVTRTIAIACATTLPSPSETRT